MKWNLFKAESAVKPEPETARNTEMSSNAVTPAPPATIAPPAPKETQAEKFESVITKIGHVLEDVVNIGAKVAEAEEGTLSVLLPPAVSSTFASITNFVVSQLGGVESKYTAIGKTNVPYAQKVAEVVATSGGLILQTLANAGITLGATTLSELVAGLGVLGSLNLSTITAAPVPVTPTTTT